MHAGPGGADHVLADVGGTGILYVDPVAGMVDRQHAVSSDLDDGIGLSVPAVGKYKTVVLDGNIAVIKPVAGGCLRRDDGDAQGGFIYDAAFFAAFFFEDIVQYPSGDAAA